MKDIFYKSGKSLCVLSGEKSRVMDSGFIERYAKNSREIAQQHQWKNSGYSAMFQQGGDGEENDFRYEVNGISRAEPGFFVYSVNCEGISAIIKKNIDTGEESSVIHTNNLIFFGLSASDDNTEIISSTSSDKNYFVKDISVFNADSNDLKTITAGDSLDEYPAFSRFNNLIYFSSRGVARSREMIPVGVSESEILSINTQTNAVAEVIKQPGVDFIMPKTDNNGNLYYIKKTVYPRKAKRGQSVFGYNSYAGKAY